MKTSQTKIREIYILMWKDLSNKNSKDKVIGICKKADEVNKTLQKHCRHNGKDNFTLFRAKATGELICYQNFSLKTENYAS